MKSNKNTTQNQLHKANQVLKDLADGVTAGDKDEAMNHLDIKSDKTILKYLRGEGTNLDTAMDFIRFFNKRIEEREKTLATVAA